MASKKLLERAETVLELVQGTLLNGDDNIEEENQEIDDEDEETENDPEEPEPQAKDSVEARKNKKARGIAKKMTKMLNIAMKHAVCGQKKEIIKQVEAQLETVTTECDRVKKELEKSQKVHQQLTSKLEAQCEDHRMVLRRLDSEHHKAIVELEKELQAKERVNEEAIENIKKELKALGTECTNLKAAMNEKDENHRSVVNELTEKLHHTQSEQIQLKTHHQSTEAELRKDLDQSAAQNRELVAEKLKLEHGLKSVELEKSAVQLKLEASNVKVNELKRAIAVLEANPHTSTTEETQGNAAYTCPICSGPFHSLADMQLHAEDCGT
ncbi:myosin heavy chain, clone 203-like [Anopheles nili]|uniref:myosin heavy chain, clone 203-like n=1 Tax=Anopheles nili TaxID=185578 RepID=UPI00237A73A3|nr:myosin heavy chain, clone 203-like [Anopheles nili]